MLTKPITGFAYCAIRMEGCLLNVKIPRNEIKLVKWGAHSASYVLYVIITAAVFIINNIHNPRLWPVIICRNN